MPMAPRPMAETCSPWPRVLVCIDTPGIGSGTQQGLDRAALVHRAVALGCLVQWQSEVEDLAGVDRAVADELDQSGQEPPHRCRAAVQVDVAEEQLLARQLNAVGNADIADVT